MNDLDRKLAEFMGYKRLICPTNTDGTIAAVYIDHITTQERWQPSENIEQAMMVVEKLISEKNAAFDISNSTFADKRIEWSCEIDGYLYGNSNSLPMAICLAAMQMEAT